MNNYSPNSKLITPHKSAGVSFSLVQLHNYYLSKKIWYLLILTAIDMKGGGWVRPCKRGEGEKER